MLSGNTKQQLLNMTPKERLEFISEIVDMAILATPSGPERNIMADANIALLGREEGIKKP